MCILLDEGAEGNRREGESMNEHGIILDHVEIDTLNQNDFKRIKIARKCKPQPDHIDWNYSFEMHPEAFSLAFKLRGGYRIEATYCPTGKVGDRLWVREKHQAGRDAGGKLVGIAFGKKDMCAFTNPLFPANAGGDWALQWKTAASTQLPRWASRFTLEVESVDCQKIGTPKSKLWYWVLELKVVERKDFA